MATLPAGFEIEQPNQQQPQPAGALTLPAGFQIEIAAPIEQLAQPEGTQNVTTPSVINSGALPVDRVQPGLAAQPEPTTGEQALGTLETVAAIGSGAIAEPIAGIVGLVTAPFIGIDEAVKNIAATRDLLTFKPRSEESKAQLQAIGETIQPVAGAVSKIESVLGDTVLELTGSPALAAAAHSLPTAALELIGVKGLRGARLKGVKLSNEVAEAITQAAPDLKTIKSNATKAYNDLDNLGIRVKPQVFERFANKLSNKLKGEGIDPTLHPKSTAAIGRILDDIGQSKKPSELDTLRKIAKDAASSIDPSDARLGNIIVKEIDDALDSLSTQIGGKFEEARALSQRAFKSQAITDMIENASHTASGMENGLRIEARKILKNKKKRRGFSKDELSALRQIEQGTTSANAAKFLGKFGISEGQATSMLGASIGIGGGGAIGSFFGPGGAAIGALAVPALGQFAKKTAQRITLNNTKFADDLVRSGKNANDITRAYLKHTPIADRSISDLTDLLLDTNLTPASIKSLPSSKSTAGKLAADAVHFSKEIKRRAQQAGSAALIAQPELKETKQ